MIKYEKHIGKKVLITDDGIYFGKVGTLLNVVNTEWYSQNKIAHVSVEGSVAIVLPVNKIALMIPTNKMEVK